MIAAAELETSEKELYRRMRYSLQETGHYVQSFPLSLLMEWDRIRKRINPDAKSEEMSRFDNAGLCR